MKADIWMPIYIGDYVADTMHLTTEQHGAYFLLLMAGWKSDGMLPDKDQALAAIARLEIAAWLKMKETIKAFYMVSGGCWIQKRQFEEIKNAISRREAARRNGKKGGRPARRKITHK